MRKKLRRLSSRSKDFSIENFKPKMEGGQKEQEIDEQTDYGFAYQNSYEGGFYYGNIK